MERIKSVHIENYKGFKGSFDFELNPNINIIVGNNESGKSTILEAIHLALTGVLNGRYLKTELSQYLFNNEVVDEYIQKCNDGIFTDLPYLLIELYFDDADPVYKGIWNSKHEDCCGISYKITFNEDYSESYEDLLKKDMKTLPIEYYDVEWKSFAGIQVLSRNIPIKSALIDSTSNKLKNGSDFYISRIIKDCLEEKEKVDVIQAYRKMQDSFMDEESIRFINKKIKEESQISDKEVKLSVDLSSRNAWEGSLMTYLNNIPFDYIGKGEQCVVKTKLAFAQKRTQRAGIVLMEEPENHLSYSKLNELISFVKKLE